MLLRSIAVMFIALAISARADDAGVALKRYETLKQNSAKLTQKSSEGEVEAALGNPMRRGFGGWGPVGFNTKVWTYLDYSDDSHHCWFQATFRPEQGWTISGRKILRSEVEKLPKHLLNGTIIDVFPIGFHGTLPEFCCSVRCDNGEVIYVSTGKYPTIGSNARVTGKPARDGRVRIEYFGTPPGYVVQKSVTSHLDFTSAGMPHLESVHFTPPVIK